MAEQKKIRVGVVGLGHRGRWMMRLASKFECAVPVAACDILKRNWYEKCWGEEMPLAEIAPEIKNALLQEKQRAAYESKINQLKILYPVDMTI
jgi:hypothetical protein